MKRLISFVVILVLLVNLIPLSLRAEDDEGWQTRSSQAEKWFFHDLPRHIGNDFKETFWNQQNLIFLAMGTGFTLGIHGVDNDIRESFQPEHPLGGAADVFNIMGNGLVLGGATATTFVISKLVDAPKVALTAGTMFESFFLTEAITGVLKYTVNRERPDGSDSHSFPSGHSSGAFALATVAEVYYGPLIGIPSYAVASMIGLSRIDADKHFASDVMAGALLGTLMGLGTAEFHKKEFSNFFLVPSVEEGKASLSLVHPF